MKFPVAPPYPTSDPIQALLATTDDAVLAIIAGVEGPSYRPVGATMTIFSEDQRTGSLSSGCIESDIALQALETLKAGTPRMLRYGRGSPFIDIQLPCGGGLDILLLPRPDRKTLARLEAKRAERRPCSLEIALDNGALKVVAPFPTQRDDTHLRVLFEPAIRFLIFGKGPEASTFAALVRSADYPNLLLSPDRETLDHGMRAGCEIRHLEMQRFPDSLNVDDHTAVVLFFHDHDWEPPILSGALRTPAFYIGAQGSQRARDQRMMALQAMDVSDDGRARLHGPVGLIPSTRDPRTLAVSVLAEVLAKAMAKPG